MRQHIFKVGWLLSRNHKVTVFFYYALFLPGIFLHELISWLAAGIINVRATREVMLPQDDDILQQELGFVRIAPNASPIRRAAIEVVPLLLGLLALWIVATEVLAVEDAWRQAATGELESVAAAVRQLTTQADFWLWFYLAFSIANTMSPRFPAIFRKRRRAFLLMLPILLATLVLGLGTNRSSDFTMTVEALLHSLTSLLVIITAVNLLMALALGSIEALIERVTGHSATFEDGKLRTVTRGEARSLRDNSPRKEPRPPAPVKQEAKPRSIYALPLPIPGPPGVEPVSRRISAVLDLRKTEQTKAKAAVKVDGPALDGEIKVARSTPATLIAPRILSDVRATAPPEQATSHSKMGFSRDRPPESSDSVIESNSTTAKKDDFFSSDGQAPFSRPFAGDEFAFEDEDDEESLPRRDPGFSRPFALPEPAETDEGALTGSIENQLRTELASNDDINTIGDSSTTIPRPSTSKNRPAPKPSRRNI